MVGGLRKAGEKRAGGGSSKKGTEGEKEKKKVLNISQSKKLEKRGWSRESTEGAGGVLDGLLAVFKTSVSFTKIR